MLANSRPAFSATARALSLTRARQVHRTFSTTRLRLSDKNGLPTHQHGLSNDPLKQGDGTIKSRQTDQHGFDAIKHQLRAWTTRNAIAIRQRMDVFSTNARIAFAQLGGRLNEVTGYHEIEQLKKLVVENGTSLRPWIWYL